MRPGPEGGLVVGERLVARRADLERGIVSRDAHGFIVALARTDGGLLVVEVADEQQGEALVAALDLDAAHVVASFRFDSPAQPWAPYLWIGLVVPIPFIFKFMGAPVLALPALFAWYCVAVVAGLPTYLEVGLDGLVVRWLGRRERVRFDQLRGVHHAGTELQIERLDGQRRELSLRWSHFDQETSSSTGFASKVAYLDAVVKRAREAALVSQERRRPVPPALARGSRDLESWVLSLKALTSRGAAGFRDLPTVVDQLWTTLEDAHAPETARAAAAIALGPTLSDADRSRLREAARVTSSPGLRFALEAAADSDEASSVEALTELEGEDALVAKRLVSSS